MKNNQQKKIYLKNKAIQKEIRKLVMERIKTLSGDLRVSVGFSSKGYTKDELIESVKKGSVSQRTAAFLLWRNIRHQLVLGNKEATIN